MAETKTHTATVQEVDRKAHRVNLFDALYYSVFSFGIEKPLQQTLSEEEQKTELSLIRDERIQMMQKITNDLTDEEPSNENYQGRLGFLYAKLGDIENADRIFQMLGKLDKPYLYGQNIFWQAVITAQLGEPSRAVSLLYDAQSKGDPFGSSFHRNPIWQPIKGSPAFNEFIRPKR